MKKSYFRSLFTSAFFCSSFLGHHLASAQTFLAVTGNTNPFNGVDVGTNAAPTFGKLDNDQDFDSFIGEGSGNLNYYRNTGTVSAAVFSLQTNGNDPMNNQDIGSNAAPFLVDIDNDGDLDLFIGESSGVIFYYRNTGSASAPAYQARTGTNNPFNGVDVGSNSTPTFVDVDGDGDMDCFIGNSNGIISYYKNTGSASSPTFSNQTGSNNPFNGVDIGSNSAPTFADIDKDGDLDCIIGASDGSLNYYKNTGTSSVPVFTAQTGASNPFNGIDVGSNSMPAFVDIDNDTDLDLFVGESGGGIFFFQNTTPLPVEFLSFTGDRAGSLVNLEWATAVEINNYGFEIQRSVDGSKWQELGFVAGQGTTQDVQVYKFRDVKAVTSVSYYRLKQVDFDGGFSYSEKVEVKAGIASSALKVFPNPVTGGVLNLEAMGLEDGKVKLQIVDLLGKTVQETLVTTVNQSVLVSLNLQEFPAGLYFVKLVGANQQMVQRIVVE